MDFGGHQEAATKAYRAKVIRRGSRAAEAGRTTCRPEGVPQSPRLRRSQASTTHLTRVAVGPTPCIRSVSGTSQPGYYLDRLLASCLALIGTCLITMVAGPAFARSVIAPAYSGRPVKQYRASPARAARAFNAAYQYANTLTAGWFGWRSRLERSGLSVGGSLIQDGSWNFLGGISTRQFVYRSRLDINAAIHLHRLAHDPGGQIYIDMMSLWGQDGNNVLLGTLQQFDNIDASPNVTEIYELYYRQKLWRDRLEFKIGQMDANDIFDNQPDTGSFLNPSTTNAATDYLLPTFPSPVPGAVLYWRPRKSTQLILGSFYTSRFYGNSLDALLNTLEPVGQPYGTFMIGELDQHYQVGSHGDGLIGLGAFYHLGSVATLAGGQQQGFGGVYGFVDQTLWRGGRHHYVNGFCCLSAVDGRVSPIDYAANGGFLIQGLVPGRPRDQLGLAADWAHVSRHAGLAKPYELGLEGFYAIDLGRGITLQPDLQYWDNTGGGAYPNALVATIRLEMNF